MELALLRDTREGVVEPAAQAQQKAHEKPTEMEIEDRASSMASLLCCLDA